LGVQSLLYESADTSVLTSGEEGPSITV